MWSRTANRQAKARNTPIKPEPDEHVVAHFDSAFAPCGCVTHQVWTIDACTIAWKSVRWLMRYRLRCLTCGRIWSRKILPDSLGQVRLDQLVLDASHPEERAARAARRSS